MLTTRWTPLRKHSTQRRFYTNEARYSVVPAGRRGGKTEIAKRRGVRRALSTFDCSDAMFIFCAPTRDQAKSLYWSDLKRLVPKDFIVGKPNESDLSIPLITGNEIRVVGMDRPERAEGRPIKHAVLDEYANMKPDVWKLHLRPALSDTLGSADFIGVPEGRNHYYDLYKAAQADESGDWQAYAWPSSEILPASEIDAARRDMDKTAFEQEYEASFVSFQGRAYYNYTEKTHAMWRLPYDPLLPLILCWDFNVDPGTCVIAQENEFDREIPGAPQVSGTLCIGEVRIGIDSNTPKVCRKILEGWSNHRGEVHCYGDPAGGSRSTKGEKGSDWDIVKSYLRPAFGGMLKFRWKRTTPHQRPRINAINNRLESANGTVRMLIDPVKCPWLVKDLEGVRVLPGGSGELDKKSDPELTHLTDGLGYYLVKAHSKAGKSKGATYEML